jgi:hypothetical protein
MEVKAMKSSSLKFGCASLAFVTALVIGSATLQAIDSNNRYFAYGLGQRSCDDYVNFREKKLEALEKPHERYTKDELYEIVDRIVEHWIAGFLTAHNLYVSDTYDVAGKSNMNDLKARLEKSCRSNPKQPFAQAMISVVQQLNPQRVKAEGGK